MSLLTQISPDGGRLLVVPLPAWGHIQPLTTMAIKVVQLQADLPSEKRTFITFFIVGDFNTRVNDEIAKSVKESPEYKNDLLEVISIGGTGLETAALVPVLLKNFEPVYDKLLAEHTITCASTGTIYNKVPNPSAVLVDHFACPIIKAIRSKGQTIPVFAFLGNTACCVLWWFAPEKYGGHGDVRTRIVEQIKPDMSRMEKEMLMQAARCPALGDIIHLPGLPPFYDYEYSPQDPLSITSLRLFPLSPTLESLSLSAGILVNTSSAYEPAAMHALRTWLDSIDKAVYDVGPLVPIDYGSSEPVESSEVVEKPGRNNDAIQFLDEALKKHGERSVVYCSFGSLFWPNKSEYVWAWLELLLELVIPFILSMATLSNEIPETLAANIKQSGLGLLLGWAPQPAILSHKATGWFMSHCGHNSVIESMAAGIPIIGWPIIGDHPFMATYQDLTLDAAFELVQVRTGARGLRAMYRGKLNQLSDTFVQPQGTLEAVIVEARDIMSRARGEEGKKKRRNAEVLQDMVKSVWGPEGESTTSLEAFLDRFGGH